MSDKKPCALEGAAPGDAVRAHDGAAARPDPACALLRPDEDAVAPAPPEDESADPVGDGHSDADFAARHPLPPPPKKGPPEAGL